MLSYRHGFHAGNHADVLKHLVLVQLLDRLRAKDKPCWYIDTHAGAGRYALGHGFAHSHGEFASGISRLWQADSLTLAPALARYLEVVRAQNPGAALHHYPGSPWIARLCLRAQDRLWLHELHSADYRVLEKSFRDSPVPATVRDSDGFAALRALLPPQPRRALVTIDPSYEMKSDYGALLAALRDALKRFASGMYLVWYPLLARREARDLPARLAAAAGTTSWLDARLQVHAGGAADAGLHGSGVFVLNPPHTLEGALKAALPQLVALLGQDAAARFDLASSENQAR